MVKPSKELRVADDFLAVRYALPFSSAVKAKAEMFAGQALQGSQGRRTTVEMEDKNTGTTAYLERGRFNRSWNMKITGDIVGAGDNISEGKDLGTIRDRRAVQIGAEALALSIMEPKRMLEDSMDLFVEPQHLVAARVGETKRIVGFQEDWRKSTPPEGIVFVDATVPMPKEYGLIVDRALEHGVIDDDEGVISVGHRAFGKIRANQNAKGDWEATGLGHFDYERVFSGQLDSNDIAQEMAQDLASLKLGEDAISEHLCLVGFDEKTVTAFQTEHGHYDFQPDGADPS